MLQAAGDANLYNIMLHWNSGSWELEGSLPRGFQPQAVTALPNQPGVWAVGNGSAHWDGHRWTAVRVPTTLKDLPLAAFMVIGGR